MRVYNIRASVIWGRMPVFGLDGHRGSGDYITRTDWGSHYNQVVGDATVNASREATLRPLQLKIKPGDPDD